MNFYCKMNISSKSRVRPCKRNLWTGEEEQQNKQSGPKLLLEGVQLHLRYMKEKNFTFLSIKGKKKKISGTSTLCVQKRKKSSIIMAMSYLLYPACCRFALCASRSSAEMIITIIQVLSINQEALGPDLSHPHFVAIKLR